LATVSTPTVEIDRRLCSLTFLGDEPTMLCVLFVCGGGGRSDLTLAELLLEVLATNIVAYGVDERIGS